MKYGSIVCTVLFIIGVLLTLSQMWFSFFTAAVFIKTLITLIALFLIVLVVTLVSKEYFGQKEMKRKGFID